MPNVDYLTPEPGALGRELSRVLEAIRDNWSEGGSFAGALSPRATGLDDARVRRLADALATGLRETHDAADELIAFVERVGGGRSLAAITVRDLAVARPARWDSRRVGLVVTRAMAIVGSGMFGAAEAGILPPWCRLVGFLIGLAGGAAMPGVIRKGEGRP